MVLLSYSATLHRGTRKYRQSKRTQEECIGRMQMVTLSKHRGAPTKNTEVLYGSCTLKGCKTGTILYPATLQRKEAHTMKSCPHLPFSRRITPMLRGTVPGLIPDPPLGAPCAAAPTATGTATSAASALMSRAVGLLSSVRGKRPGLRHPPCAPLSCLRVGKSPPRRLLLPAAHCSCYWLLLLLPLVLVPGAAAAGWCWCYCRCCWCCRMP